MTAPTEGEALELALQGIVRAVGLVGELQVFGRLQGTRSGTATGHSGVPEDASWFYDFYASTASRLRGYLGQLVRSQDLADDLLQESYLRLLRAELPTHEPRRLRSYLYTTATNLARDHWRREARRREESLDGLEPASTPHEAGLGLDISEVMKELPEKQRSLLWLAYVEGASHREIAVILGLQEASVRVLLFRARGRIAALLRSRGLAPGGANE